MDRMSALPVIALIAVAAVIGTIAVTGDFDQKTLRAEVIEMIHGNTLVLDIGTGDLNGLGAEIGDDILVKSEKDSFTVLLSPDSKYKGIPIYGGYIADESGKVTIGYSSCNHVTLDFKVATVKEILTGGI